MAKELLKASKPGQGGFLELADRYREMKGLRKWVSIFLIIVCLSAVVMVLFRMTILGFAFMEISYMALVIALILPQTFIYLPYGRGARRDIMPWYDILLATSSFLIFFYFSLKSYDIAYGLWSAAPPWHAQIMGLIGILLILEATRRCVGWFLPILCLSFSMYPLVAPFMPDPFTGISYPFWPTFALHAFGGESIFGTPLRVVTMLLIGFFVFASAIIASGAASFFSDFAAGLLGRFRGGPAKVAVVSSGLFGSLSGSASANVLTTGSVTIPTMKQSGYPAYYAGAIEAAASTGGNIMPPVMGVVAFIMAEFLAIPYARIVVAAFIPAFLYYLAIFLQTDAYAAKVGLKGLPRDALPSVRRALAERGWYIGIAVAILLYTLLVLVMEAQAPLIATVPLFILPMLRKSTRLGMKHVIAFLQGTARMLAELVPMVSAIGLIIGSLMMTGAAPAMSRVILEMAGGNVIILLILGAVVAFVLGMGMTVSAIYIILAIILVPALISFGINPMAAHLFVVYFATVSFITPPVAIASFLASTIAQSPFMKTGWTSSRLGIGMYLVPFLFVLQPGMILNEPSFMRTVVPIFTAIVGLAFISWGAEGYAIKLGMIPSWARVLFLVGGILVAWPGVSTRLIGVGLLGLTVAYLAVRKGDQVREAAIALPNERQSEAEEKRGS